MQKNKKSARNYARNYWKPFLMEESKIEHMLDFLAAYLDQYTGSRIFASQAMKDEISVIALLEKMKSDVFLPVVTGANSMEFRLFLKEGRQVSELKKGSFGIMEPDSLEKAFPEAGDCIIIPALGSNSEGYRLGRGAGFYDRWKDRLSDVDKITLLPEALIALKFNHENHDLQFNRIITEDRIVDNG